MDFTPYIAPDLYDRHGPDKPGCKACGWGVMPLHFGWDYPIQQRLRRVRERIPLSLPPDEEEVSCQAAWETVVRDFESNMCYHCSIRKHKKKWPILAHLDDLWEKQKVSSFSRFTAEETTKFVTGFSALNSVLKSVLCFVYPNATTQEAYSKQVINFTT